MYRHLIVILLLAAVQAGCGGLPKPVDRVSSSTFLSPLETSLGQQLAAHSRKHPRESGILLLDSGRDAFRYRAALIRAAERSLDLQYFIWNDDRSGNFMAGALLEAANRGVRVRLLLDDFHAVGNDEVIPALNAHPNVEVRVFNPIMPRKGPGRWLGLLADVKLLNRRMHNKALVVDGAAAVVGGRNIGDEYFDLREDWAFLDRDLLVTGAVVAAIGQGFDSYWNSEWSYPLEVLAEKSLVSETDDTLSDILQQREQPDIPVPEDRRQALAMLLQAADGLIWAPAELVVDRVTGLNEGSDRPKEVALRLVELIEQARSDILIESAYLVIGEPGVALLGEAQRRGVRVRTLTNSLASNDVLANHAAYVRRRAAMLDTGMELHELMPRPADCAQLTGGAGVCETGGNLGLHTKSAVFDGATTFVGSFNVNMRSVYLNTEMGLLVHSPELAARIVAAAQPKYQADNSWQVKIKEDGGLLWSGRRDGGDQQLSGEPNAGFSRTFGASLLSLIPGSEYF